MNLSNKYNISQDVINKMVKDGVISCTWPMYEEIYAMYQSSKSSGKSKTEIYYEIAEKKKMSEATVKYICLKMDKI